MSDGGVLLNSALWYASKGWKIIPCHGIKSDLRCTCKGDHIEPKDAGKHAVNSWNTTNTSDPETIRRWWSTEPMYNIGVVCRSSGFLVLDIDPRNGGFESYEKFKSMLGEPLPKTIEALTGNYNFGENIVRGRHVFFKCDPSEEFIGNLSAAGLEGIDVKHNGYVLIAPSNHYSGIKYEWVKGNRPDELEMAEAPEFLLNALRKRRRKKGGTSLGTTDWDEIFSKVQGGDKLNINKLLSEGLKEGERAIKIYQIACALANIYPVHEAHGELAVETLMIRFNAEKVVPPMELEGTNSLLMHTRRAIEFVKSHPKHEMITGGPVSFAKKEEWAHKVNSDQRSKELVVTSSSDPVSTYSPDTRSSITDTSYELKYDEPSPLINALVSGKTIEQAISNRNMDIAPDQDSLYAEDGGTPGQRSLTDVGNGRRLVDKFSPILRYSEGLGWFFWNNSHWKPDVERLDIKELAKKIGSIVLSEIDSYEDDTDKKMKVARWGIDSKSVSRINSAIDSANSDSRIRIKVEDWDKSPNLLGVTNGVIDLRTGALLKNEPGLYITRSCPVGYIQGQKNSRWDQFLEFATGGDKEYQDWLQRAAGYTITGHRNHDIMFLVYGPAGTGKNTFVEALVKCLGTKQYAWPFDTSVLSQTDGRSNPQDQYHWAELRGRRMVWVDELPDSERLKENSVKRLTGSSEITGRSPGERPFTFSSQAKLWISTNHRPIITDDAMWRRIRPIPFINVPERLDPDLKDYIFDPNGALPAVLSWAVEGAIKLLGSPANDQLGWCNVVREAADVYRKNEDRIGLFLDEETRENSSASVPMKDLFTLYKIWSEQRGERALTQIAFDRKLRDRNLSVEGSGSRAIVHGRMMPPRSVNSEPIPNIGLYSIKYGSDN